MSWQKLRCAVAASAMSAALCLGVSSAHADAVNAADLKAVSNALGFLQGLPHGAPITVGVVFSSDADDQKQAAATAAMLQTIPAPNQSSFKSVLIAAKDLARTPDHLDVLLLMPDAVAQSAVIADAARKRRLMVVSTNPECLNTGCCVLMVHTQGRVRIVLDTQMADVVGANFSSVFAMMVERK